MATSIVEPERIAALNAANAREGGEYVLYWMQASMRAEHNPALEHSSRLANDHGVPLVVAAVIVADYPDASARHFAFMLGGMGQALRAVQRRGATVTVRLGEPVDVIARLADEAVVVITDRGYLRHQREWRDGLADRVDCALLCVEGDVVVPIDVVSDRQEYAARTIRSKINRCRDDFIVELSTTSIDHTTNVTFSPDSRDDVVELDRFDDIEGLMQSCGISTDAGPQPVDWITPGTRAARARLDRFLDEVGSYADDRNRFHSASTSLMSPYLHFGQISPVVIAQAVLDHVGEDAEDYLEELIVRRELAANYVEHCVGYDAWAGLPEWARTSLEAHEGDERDDVYTAGELEAGSTHDELWNAIMDEIRNRGWVHNQLRMYWGKQIIRWTNTPQHAHRTLLELNNRWFLDGRDASSYANVGWCFGLHDQGFQERDVSGKLRPFTDAALRRKDDLNSWLDERT